MHLFRNANMYVFVKCDSTSVSNNIPFDSETAIVVPDEQFQTWL